MAGGAENGSDFAFRVKLVVNNVKTRVAIMTVIRTAKIAIIYTSIITIINIYIFLFFINYEHIHLSH